MDDKEVTQEPSIGVDGRARIEAVRWLTVRRALKIEIETGMRRSNRGRPTIVLANEISGCTSRNKRVAYKALDDKIAEVLGEDQRKPL
jgi:hypothetical protein